MWDFIDGIAIITVNDNSQQMVQLESIGINRTKINIHKYKRVGIRNDKKDSSIMD